MKHDPKFNMHESMKTVFISHGHISLYFTVFWLDLDILISPNYPPSKINSRLQGHPATEEGLPSEWLHIGKGLSVSEAALAKKINNDPKHIFAQWVMVNNKQRKLQCLSHNKLDNLIAT